MLECFRDNMSLYFVVENFSLNFTAKNKVKKKQRIDMLNRAQPRALQ